MPPFLPRTGRKKPTTKRLKGSGAFLSARGARRKGHKARRSGTKQPVSSPRTTGRPVSSYYERSKAVGSLTKLPPVKVYGSFFRQHITPLMHGVKLGTPEGIAAFRAEVAVYATVVVLAEAYESEGRDLPQRLLVTQIFLGKMKRSEAVRLSDAELEEMANGVRQKLQSNWTYVQTLGLTTLKLKPRRKLKAKKKRSRAKGYVAVKPINRKDYATTEAYRDAIKAIGRASVRRMGRRAKRTKATTKKRRS